MGEPSGYNGESSSDPAVIIGEDPFGGGYSSSPLYCPSTIRTSKAIGKADKDCEDGPETKKNGLSGAISI